MSQDRSVGPMRMGSAADLMWQSDSAHRPIIKAFAVDEDAFRRSSVFVGHKADQIPVVLLRGDDAVENAIDALVQGRVVTVAERLARAFESLVNVGVEGAVADDAAVREGGRTVGAGRVTKITN